MCRYEVEFGLTDAVARLANILKRKISRTGKGVPKLPTTTTAQEPATAAAALVGGSQSNGSAPSGASSEARNISSSDVLAAEKTLDEVMQHHSVCYERRCSGFGFVLRCLRVVYADIFACCM